MGHSAWMWSLLPGGELYGLKRTMDRQQPGFQSPTQADPAVQAAAAAEAAKRRRAMGYQATILTQPQQGALKQTTGA